MYLYKTPDIQKFIQPITKDSIFDISEFRNTNGTFHYNLTSDRFNLDGELHLIDMLVMGIKWRCYKLWVKESFKPFSEFNLVVKDNPSVLESSFKFFETLLEDASFKIYFNGLFNPNIQTAVIKESKGGRVFADELSLTIYDLIDLIALTASIAKVSPWDELNYLFDDL